MVDVKYSIVVPCYNSADMLEELATRICVAMASYAPFEIIFVNDKSLDDQKTWLTIKKVAGEKLNVRGIDLLYNVGQFKATLCGIEKARGKYIITMDDDLQHPPEELPKLIEALQQNPKMDCIMGRYDSKKHSYLRNLGSLLVQRLMNGLYEKPVGVVTTSFRIMPDSFARVLINYQTAFPQLGPLIASLSQRIGNVPVEHHPRKVGRSGYSLAKCVKETFQSVINASTVPLRCFSVMGFITSGIAFLMGINFFFRWLFGGIRVAGFTSLILAVSFFSGLLLAGIGILGEYIKRIIQEITGLPRYQVKTIVGGGDEQGS